MEVGILPTELCWYLFVKTLVISPKTAVMFHSLVVYIIKMKGFDCLCA